MKTYQLLITDRGRVLLATYTTVGGLTDEEAHERAAVRVSGMTRDGGEAVLVDATRPPDQRQQLHGVLGHAQPPDRNLKLSAVPGDFVNALNV